MNELATTTVLLFGVLLGSGITAFLTRHKVSKSTFDVLDAESRAAQTKISELNGEKSRLEAKLEALVTSSQESREQVASLEAEKKSFQEKIMQHQKDIEQMDEKLRLQLENLETATTISQQYREQIATFEAEKKAFQEKALQHQKDIEQMNEKFHLQFENLANKIFDEKTSKFQKVSQEGLNLLLAPLKERLQEFQKKVDDSFGSQAKEQFSLKREIERIVTVNEKMTLQTESLSKALKGDIKAQGTWGEIMLEKILEESGLRKGKDYIVQGADMGLKHAEDGRVVKPDVIVMLPEDKHIIIDSKVSLTHYEKYCATEDEAQRAIYLKDYLSSIRNHVSGLEQRRYQDTEKLGTPDFVLMFMPIEGAYSLAIQQDAALHNHAWDKKIVIVCPSTLFATLRTIASVWRLELQNQNAIEIARRGGALYDKVFLFIEDMQKLGRHLEAAKSSYADTMNKLSEGRGNILRRTEDLKVLGVKASKKLPVELLSPAGTGEDAEIVSITDKAQAG